MIRLRDALTLSVTKLKTRRIRLAIMTIVSGIFFVLLVLVSLLFTGVMSSIDLFSKEGLGGRYIVRLEPIDDPDLGLYEDKELIAKAKQADAALIAQKKAVAKRLGIEYEPTSEALAVPNEGPDTAESVTEMPHVRELLQQYRRQKSEAFFAAMQKSVAEYGAIAQHRGMDLYGGYAGASGGELPTMIPIKNNQEIELTEENAFQAGFTTIGSGLTVLDDSVLESFVLPSQSFATDKSAAVPVIAPYSAVEEALGLVPLSANAPSEERLTRLKEVREKAAGKTFEVCIRNSASLERQSEARLQAEDIRQNKGKPEFVAPEVVYGLATVPCRDVVVTKDIRSIETKQTDAKQLTFDRQFGRQAPEQRLVTFKIVGISPDMNIQEENFRVASILSGLVSSNLGSGWLLPSSASEQLPEYKSTLSDLGKIASYQHYALVEFSSADEARRFIKEKTCEPDFSAADPYTNCRENDKPFIIGSYGSNSVALEEVRTWFERSFVQAALVVAALSAFTMMGTVGKVIADSRRETAVFRAIGAKRLDIAAIYVLYTVLLGLVITAFAFIGGIIIALIIDARYGSEVTVDALTIFNSQDLTQDFVLAKFNWSQLGKLVLIIMSAAIVSAIIPLINNLKRNPIKDMRDER